MERPMPSPTLFPYTTLFRSRPAQARAGARAEVRAKGTRKGNAGDDAFGQDAHGAFGPRSEEHTSELQSCGHLVCRLLLEKKNNTLAVMAKSKMTDGAVIFLN